MESRLKNKFFSIKKCHSYILAHVYLKKVKENILLIYCSFKNHLNKKNYKCCWFNVVNDQCHTQTSLSLWKIYMQRKVGRRKRARGASPFPNLWSLALCYQSLACHVHFVLASMQKMKHLRRTNGHLLSSASFFNQAQLKSWAWLKA